LTKAVKINKICLFSDLKTSKNLRRKAIVGRDEKLKYFDGS
jgi:hypothetical protein